MAAKNSNETKTKQERPAESAPNIETVAAVESSSDALSYQKIAERAFQLYEERGAEDGHALDDWLAAEQQVVSRDQAG